MSENFTKIIRLESSEKFQFAESTRAIILVVEDFSPDADFCAWLEKVPAPVILALKSRTGENLVAASHLCVAATGGRIENLSAEELLERGLINKIVPPEDLESTAREIAETISRLAPLAIRACLKAVSEGLQMTLSDGLQMETELFTEIFSTADMREGTSAFLGKRKPIFSNE